MIMSPSHQKLHGGSWASRRLVVGPLLLAACLAGVASQAAESTPTQKHIADCIKQLGDDDYFVRERAQEELARVGVAAFDALTAAKLNDDIEIADRAKYLIRMMRIPWAAEGDSAEAKRLLETYEAADEKNRLDTIEQLAKLSDNQGLKPLCRLARFEKSEILSKSAAIQIMEEKVPSGKNSEQRWKVRQQVIAEALGQSPRRAAHWLRTYLVAHDDPLLGAAAWIKIGTEETHTLHQAPQQTRADVLVGLAMQIYAAAQECATHGGPKQAEELGDVALKLNADHQRPHLFAAFGLQKRGQFKWAELEYRRAIEIGPAGQGDALNSQELLSEMLHDQGSELTAAKVREDAAAAIEATAQGGRQFEGSSQTLESMRARMHYFYACYEETQKNRAKQLEHLLKGIAQDPLDADILISLYRVPNLEPDLRERVQRLIRDAAQEFRNQIKQSPDSPTAYNQLAWLVAHTEGDKKEALQASKTSLEKKPNTAGFLDTLGRCYFALGDLENAVKFQTQATELEPYSGLMNKQLAEFKAALEKSKQKKP
jgi:tetratricopeptide (TPR) repeat protein